MVVLVSPFIHHPRLTQRCPLPARTSNGPSDYEARVETKQINALGLLIFRTLPVEPLRLRRNQANFAGGGQGEDTRPTCADRVDWGSSTCDDHKLLWQC